MIRVYIISIILIFNSLLFANPANLDTTFGKSGKVITSFGTYVDIVKDIAIQKDEKIIAVGTSYNGNHNIYAVVRYENNGSLDATFGKEGKVTTAIGGGNAVAHSIALQTDGKIIVAGTGHAFTMVRYDSNGSLDSTFGQNGIVSTVVGGHSDETSAVATTQNGRIFLAGTSFNGRDEDFALACYHNDGSLDHSFGTDGIVTTAIDNGNDEAHALAIQSDGKIIVAGDSSIDNSGHYFDTFTLVRYNLDGSLDTDFGSNGIVTTSVGVGSSHAYDITIQNDHKIVVAGYGDNGHGTDYIVVRYNEDGSLDTSFGTGGKVMTDTGSYTNLAWSVALQRDGKIVVGGESYNSSSDGRFTVVRYNKNGSLDTCFGKNGIIKTQIGTKNDIAYSVAIQSDQKILAAGGSSNKNSNYNFALVRYRGGGCTDSSSILSPVYYLLQ